MMSTGFFVALLIGLNLAALAGFLLRHVHDWEIRSAKPMSSHTAYFGVIVEDQPGEPVTQVLERCAGCGEVRIRTLRGTWTMGELAGKETKHASVVSV
jgi:hypothetical protein